MYVDSIKKRIDMVAGKAGVPGDAYSFSDEVSADLTLVVSLGVHMEAGVTEKRVPGLSSGRKEIDRLPAFANAKEARAKVLREATAKAEEEATGAALEKNLGDNPVVWAKHGAIPKTAETGHYAHCAEGCTDCNSKGRVRCHHCNGHTKLTCGGCRGKGIVRCNVCGGDATTHCYGCSGTGRVARHRRDGGIDYVYCGSCSGRGRTMGCHGCGLSGQMYCTGCGGHGEVGCPTCRQAGTLECRPCKGHGTFTRFFVGTMVPRIKRDYAYTGGPKPDGKLVPKLDDDPCFKPTTVALERTGKLVKVKYTVPMPFASLTLAVGKATYHIQAAGKNMTWANVPPYLDAMMAGFIDALERARPREALARIQQLRQTQLGQAVVGRAVSDKPFIDLMLVGDAISKEALERLHNQVRRFLAQAVVRPRREFWTGFMVVVVALTGALAIAYPYMNRGVTVLTAVSNALYPRGVGGGDPLAPQVLFMAALIAAGVMAPAFVAASALYRLVSRKWLTHITGTEAEVPARHGAPAAWAGLASVVLGAGVVLLVQNFPAMLVALTA